MWNSVVFGFILWGCMAEATFNYLNFQFSAICRIDNGSVVGVINFKRNDSDVILSGNVFGLKPGNHGFHVHEYGDLSDGCKSAGGHFNPFNKVHGAPNDTERHVGDLGNIKADKNGFAAVNFKDDKIKLWGPHSIVGRSVVVHEKEDDLGKGGKPDSKKTGNAGARVGCCIIGLPPPV